MPSSYTPLLRLVLPVTGELTNTWGNTVNTGLTSLVEAAIAGTAAVAMTDANRTLSTANEATDEARQAIINLTGTLTATRNVICPATSKLYIVSNNTAGGQDIVFKTAAGTGITVAPGTSRFLRCDGTNVVEAITALSAIAAGIAANVSGVVAVVNGGTGASTAAGARTNLGTDIYKTVPLNSGAGATLVTGELNRKTAGFTIGTGLTVGDVYEVFNEAATPITITQGSGLTLLVAGTTSSGNRVVQPNGLVVIKPITTTLYLFCGIAFS